MLRKALLGISLSTAACSGLEVSFSNVSSNDEALQQAARSAGNDLNLIGQDKGFVEMSMDESFVPGMIDNRKLDILLVIDASDSMQPRRESLAANLASLFEYEGLADSDWRLAVMSSAPDSLLLQPFVTAANQDEVFAEQVKNPDSGHSDNINTERVLFNAARALRGEAGRDWLRRNSIAVMLVVTDEDHQQCNQDTESCSDDAAFSLQDFYEELRRLRNPGATAKVYGLLSDDDTQRENFLEDVQLDNGEYGSLFSLPPLKLSDDHSEVLQDISTSIASSLQNNFVLQKEYNGNQAEVVVHTADEQTITLDSDEYEIAGFVLSIYEGLLDSMGEIASISVSYTYMEEKTK